MTRRAVIKIISGPNAGDAFGIDQGVCRLIGRHLSEHQTVFRNRVLDDQAASLLSEHLKDKAPPVAVSPDAFNANALKRGPDILMSNDSISRVHAMIFFDSSGVGIIDLASTNGTYINNDSVSSALIGPDDVFTIGKSAMKVELED